MIEWLAFSFLFGIVLAVPLWWVLGRTGARGRLREARSVALRDAVPCTLEPVVLHGHLLRGAEANNGAPE